jgi:hypothetical protein
MFSWNAIKRALWFNTSPHRANVITVAHATLVSSRTLTVKETGSVITNLGAGDASTITLPQNAKRGCTFTFVVAAAQQLQIDPGAAGAITIAGAKAADDEYVWADALGESTTLVADGNGDWLSHSTNGTWTEATP